jgi:photosystem II stability/assembly factor-like uncharacterized protein
VGSRSDSLSLRAPVRSLAAALLVAALSGLLSITGAAGGYVYPRFQPVSIAFFDRQHGLLAEDDWTCQKAHGCQGRVLATTDGGAHWHVTYVGARGLHLYPVRGTQTVFALTGDAMHESNDRGLHWQRLSWSPAVVSFVTRLQGWKLGPQTLLAHPPALDETRDGGRTWTARVDPCSGDFGMAAALSFASSSRGWRVCVTQASTGFQGKAIWQTNDAGTHWRLESRTHPIGPPKPKQQLGNLPGFGYPIGAVSLADGHGWLLQDRGQTLITNDGGHTWQSLAITKPDTIAGQSATLLSDKLGFVLLRGCKVRLVRTTNGGSSWTPLARWNSPTQC